MKRLVGALAVAVVLTVASTAIAASSGKYGGTSVLHLDGSTAAHPFSLTVKSGRITRVTFLVGSDCAFLDEARGVPAKITITHDRFSARLRLRGGPIVDLAGRFSGRRVSGTITGNTNPPAGNCSIPKNSFSAKLG